MSVPDSVSIRNFNGSFSLNKQLSDSNDDILNDQGIGWIMRQAIKHSGVILNCKEYDDKGVTHVDVEQVASGGYKNLEERPLDWAWRQKEDGAYGQVKWRSRFAQTHDVGDNYLKQIGQPEVIDTVSESIGLKGGDWHAEQVWGFENVDGARRHTRRWHFKKGDHVFNIRQVYDWKP